MRVRYKIQGNITNQNVQLNPHNIIQDGILYMLIAHPLFFFNYAVIQNLIFGIFKFT